MLKNNNKKRVLLCSANAWIGTHNVSGDSKAMLSFFDCSKFSVRVCNTSDVHTRQTFTNNWSKIQLSWVLMLYYPYKTMFSAYKSVIVSPCACDLFVSKVTKITQYMDVRFWRSFFSAFSMCDDCILKSTTAWLLKLSVLYIHSFMQVHNTIFQIKTFLNNVVFSTEVHNPLHAHLLALSHIYTHTPSTTFRHLPPNSARFSNAEEGALFISMQLSTDAVSALRKVWVLIRLWKQPSALAHT